MNYENLSENQKKVLEILKNVYDPEIHINLFDLGLIYDIQFDEENKKIKIKMGLTTMFCPLAPMILGETRESVKQAFEDYDVDVELDLERPWSPDQMNPDVRNELGL
ncbi:MAG: hypothetical protein PWP03_785 [Candidatus Woesearchaeota archaeon]|nr:hypothetical protein [Candidatus Woesearchaeota archaeon]MDN5328147.1 hypothetical protein [Candidatus Woesearchaeota archaeon]